MIETEGMITVAEAAKRLRLSIEQVRRKLREGKLKGQRVGNQWFVDEAAIGGELEKPEPLIPRGMLAEIDEIARRIAERNPGYVFDPVEMVRRAREER
jgi:excisionase family DNA binding protein